MGRQKFSELHGAGIIVAHADSQAFHAAMQKKTGMWIEGSAQLIEVGANPCTQVGTTVNGTGNDIG
jgi:hypothetical protein